MTAKQKKIEVYKAKIPQILDEFKVFLGTKGLGISNFVFDESECDAIELVMRDYFKGRESEYLDLDNYQPLREKPVLKIEDSNFDSYATYIGEFLIHNTDCQWDIQTGKVVYSGDFSIKFNGKNGINTHPNGVVHLILLNRAKKNIYKYLEQNIEHNLGIYKRQS